MKIHEDEIEEKKIFRRIKTMIAAIALLSQKIQTYVCEFLLSHPAWGGWIEIPNIAVFAPCKNPRPTPRGVGGLKLRPPKQIS